MVIVTTFLTKLWSSFAGNLLKQRGKDLRLQQTQELMLLRARLLSRMILPRNSSERALLLINMQRVKPVSNRRSRRNKGKITKLQRKRSHIVEVPQETGSQSSEGTSPGESPKSGTRRTRVMQGLGFIAPPGSPFDRNGP